MSIYSLPKWMRDLTEEDMIFMKRFLLASGSLKEIAKDRLVIMVTHNPELAKEYSTRIIKLLDGEVTDDSDPYQSKDEKPKEGKLQKTSMSFFTDNT